MTNPAPKQFVKKRRVPRRRYDEDIGVLRLGTYEIGHGHEIGERGMLVTSSFEFKENDRLVVTFHVPGLLHTIVRATVRYALRDPETSVIKYGCEFEDLSFVARRMIRMYVASKQSMDEDGPGNFQKATANNIAAKNAESPKY